MKRPDLLLLACLTALSAFWLAPRPQALNIHGVQPGMTLEEVNRRLGPPTMNQGTASYGTPWLASVVFDKGRAVQVCGRQLARGQQLLGAPGLSNETVAERLGKPLATRSHPSWRGDCPETQSDYGEGLTVTYRYGKNLDGSRYGNPLFQLSSH
ncbi:hypothetical protein ABS71_17080 [bacterium SCN 62-11]|nr:hypothetical protein [Candidatus Eremiobacteraeota bacterium]ODT61021.1 MAG: hypothetical protein ABS71_17080 [bacterium SCN 62-11]